MFAGCWFERGTNEHYSFTSPWDL